MAVKNLHDGSMDLQPGDEIHNINLVFSGAFSQTMPSIYVVNGSMCTLFIPRFQVSTGITANQLINIAIPSEIYPANSDESCYDLMIVDTGVSRRSILIMDSNIIMIGTLNSSMVMSPFGAGPINMNNALYVRYQINN